MLQHLMDWPCLPSSPLPRPAATAVIDWQGRRVNWTPHGGWWRGSAVVQGNTPVRFGSSDVATSGHPFFTATVLAGCSDQGHDFLTAAYDHVRLSSFWADILTSCVLIRGCVLYIGLQIFTLWQKSKVGVRIIFEGVLYSKFYGTELLFETNNENFSLRRVESKKIRGHQGGNLLKCVTLSFWVHVKLF